MARRRYQQGRVELRGKNPKWIGRWREDVVEDDGTVRRILKSVVLGTKKEYPTERLARRRLETLISPINSVDYRPGRVATVAEFVEKWRLEVLCQRKPTTARTSESHLKNHILPAVGRLRLDELGREQQQMFVTKISRGASRKMVLNILGTLSSMLGTARKWGYVCEKLEVGGLVLPTEEVKTEARYFTPAQVRQIISRAREPFRTMFCLTAMTGIRSGELLGLKVDDIDFERRLIFIRRSVNRGHVQTVKSKASQKPVPIPDALAVILKDSLKNWRENPDRWMFANRLGRPFSPDKVVMKQLWPILDELKIPHCGLHAFRHFLSSMLLELGAAPQVAQAQMRHSDARITLEVYSHVIGDSQREAVEKVAQLLIPNDPKSSVSAEWIQ